MCVNNLPRVVTCHRNITEYTHICPFQNHPSTYVSRFPFDYFSTPSNHVLLRQNNGRWRRKRSGGKVVTGAEILRPDALPVAKQWGLLRSFT